jgi:hypothetical protein
MPIPQERERHLLFPVENKQKASFSRRRDRDDIVGGFFNSLPI